MSCIPLQNLHNELYFLWKRKCSHVNFYTVHQCVMKRLMSVIIIRDQSPGVMWVDNCCPVYQVHRMPSERWYNLCHRSVQEEMVDSLYQYTNRDITVIVNNIGKMKLHFETMPSCLRVNVSAHHLKHQYITLMRHTAWTKKIRCTNEFILFSFSVTYRYHITWLRNNLYNYHRNLFAGNLNGK